MEKVITRGKISKRVIRSETNVTKGSKLPLAEQSPAKPPDEIAGGTARISVPRKFTGRVVAITIKAKSGWARWNFTPAPLSNVDTHLIVEREQDIKAALGSLKDGDVLIFNAHANDQNFIYGRSNTKVYWTGKNGGPDMWKYFGLEKNQPKLAGVIMASCMKRKGEHLPQSRLRELRRAFHTRFIVAPDSRYELEYKDNTIAEMLLGFFLSYLNKEIDAADLNEGINRKQDRFKVSYGCNGWNHPDGCSCRFGPRWHEKP